MVQIFKSDNKGKAIIKPEKKKLTKDNKENWMPQFSSVLPAAYVKVESPYNTNPSLSY